MTKLIFLDTETTGTDPRKHVPWEIALIEQVTVSSGVFWQESLYTVWPTEKEMRAADPYALALSRFYERIDQGQSPMIERHEQAELAAGQIARKTAGAILAGNVVSFDDKMLASFLRKNGLAPAWHYHLLDVETFAAGALGLEPPWDSKRVSEQLGVAMPSEAEAHTALADARWAKDLYLAALALQVKA